MKIGNIISDDDLINHDPVEYINYYTFSSKDKIDYKLPTLFVGWITLKNTFNGNNFNILDKVIVENKDFWEFSFNENRASHVNGVSDFVDYLPKYYFESNYTYNIIDPVFSNIKDLNGLFEILCDCYDAVYNYKNEFIYLLKGNIISGIDLKMFDFFKISKQEIINYVSMITNKYINDIDGEIKINYYKLIPNYLNLRRYLVVL